MQSKKIVIDGVSKSFHSSGKTEVIKALNNVNLTIDEGEFVCLVGPSGCGKSTLLNIVAGLEKPDSGKVVVDGDVVKNPGRDRLVMFQESALFPWLDVLGNVMFGLRHKPGLSKKDAVDLAREYIKIVGLEPFERAPIHELSGGMKQRVALARALAPHPRILMMDEPFSALDALTREQLYGDIQAIWEKHRQTVLFVSHNVREAICLGDRVMLFSKTPGTIADVFKVELAHPRELGSVELTQLSAKITAALKRLL